MERYCVTAVFKCKPEKLKEMQQMIESVYIPSIEEEGCKEYRWYQDLENPADFLLFMTWENKKYFEKHLEATHVKKADGWLVDLLRAPYTVVRYKLLLPQRQEKL